jgi:MFS family permease
MPIISNIKSFSKQFWIVSSVRTIERLAYWIVLLQMPVYIAQKDLEGGLHWEQTIKGLIFFWWALVQNVSPVITGGFADKFGRKKIMFITSILIILGFLLLSITRSFGPFLFSTMLLGLGMGIFKPALEGEVSKQIVLNKGKNNSSLGWGIYITFVNIAYFLGPTFSVALKNISWDWIFWGSAIVHSVNLILLIFVKEENVIKNKVISNVLQPIVARDRTKSFISILKESRDVLKSTFSGLIKFEVIIFLVLITGFTLNHMQFYETLPNFVSDWSNTSALAKNVPQFMQKETGRGVMISFEWIYNINSTMLVLFVALSSYITRNKNLLRMCSLGLFMVTIGLFLAGKTMSGGLLITGVFVLAIGEILITPRISEYFSLIAKDNNRSQYLGYANLAWVFGLSGGGIIGGYLYQHLGEKSSFAIKYLADNFGINAEHSEALTTLCTKTGLNEIAITQLLWNTYNPWLFWLPFFIIGILSGIGLIVFSYKRKTK